MSSPRKLPKYKDRLLMDRDYIDSKIQEENLNQIEKWGVQALSAFEWLAFLTEEVGELAKAISEEEYRVGSKLHVSKEAIQVATLALKIAEMFEFSEKEKP